MMEALPRCKSRKLYSWWWDSHVSPNNSKWLQQNLADMECNVKSMIRLIEEDGDTFATRAESYFQKRPVLMRFVEEFYKSYRALAERYDCANVALRHAQLSPIDDDNHTMPPLRPLPTTSPPAVAVFDNIMKEIQSKKEELAAKFHQDLQTLYSLELELNDDGCLGKISSGGDVELSVIRETLKKLPLQSEPKEVHLLPSQDMISILQHALSLSDHRPTEGDEEGEPESPLNEHTKKIINHMESRKAELDVFMEIIAQKDRELLEYREEIKTLRIDLETSHDEEKLKSLLIQNEKLERDLALRVSQNSVLELKLCETTRKYRDEKSTLQTVRKEKNELYEKLQSLEKELNDTVQELRVKVKGLLREKSEPSSEMKKTKEKMRNMEDVHLLLQEEKKCLVNERNALLDEMQSVGSRMGSLEARFSKMEEKCSAFEISLLRKFIQQLEMKNVALALECQKHHESSTRTRIIMSQFEAENLQQLAEIQTLMDEIEVLRVQSIEEKLLQEIENMILVTFVNQTQMRPTKRIEELRPEESIAHEACPPGTGEIQVATDAQNVQLGGGRSSQIWRDDFILGEKESQSGAELKPRDIQLDQVSKYSSSRYSHMFEDWAHEIARVSRRSSAGYARTRSRRSQSRASRHRKKSSIIEFQIERESSDACRTIGEEYHDNMILQRLESDANTLISAELIVQELAAKLEARKGKNAKPNEAEAYKKQLTSLGEQILQLFGSTNQLARDIQSTSSSERSLLAERALKGSEVIGSLHFEVENMRYNVVRLIKGKKRKIPGRGISLRQFINSGDTNLKKRSKFLCGFQNYPSLNSNLTL